MQKEFNEVQRFNQWWLWLLFVLFSGLVVWSLYLQLYLGRAIGNHPISNTGLIVISLVYFALVAMFRVMALRTTIDEKGIHMHYFPFIKKSVNWNQIKTAQVVNYGFVGGWGIRLWTKYGTVYNTRGKIGLSIQLKNGEQFLIGTQKENEMKQIVQNYLP